MDEQEWQPAVILPVEAWCEKQLKECHSRLEAAKKCVGMKIRVRPYPVRDRFCGCDQVEFTKEDESKFLDNGSRRGRVLAMCQISTD